VSTREGRWPTPEEFVAEWEARTHAERLDSAARIIDSLQRSHDCFLKNHDGLEAEIRHLQSALATARMDAIEEFAGDIRTRLAEEAK